MTLPRCRTLLAAVNNIIREIIASMYDIVMQKRDHYDLQSITPVMVAVRYGLPRKT